MMQSYKGKHSDVQQKHPISWFKFLFLFIRARVEELMSGFEVVGSFLKSLSGVLTMLDDTFME